MVFCISLCLCGISKRYVLSDIVLALTNGFLFLFAWHYIFAALPWVMMGLALAVLAASHITKKQKNEKRGTCIAFGAGLGLLLGMATAASSNGNRLAFVPTSTAGLRNIYSISFPILMERYPGCFFKLLSQMAL